MTTNVVLQQTDWSFLTGTEVQQIRIGRYEVQIMLGEDIRIATHDRFRHVRPGCLTGGSEEMPFRAASLVSLLGASVVAVLPHAEMQLEVRFSNEEALLLDRGPGDYESFDISTPKDWIVVM